MKKELVIYGKDNCPQCDALKMRLAHDEIPYTYLKMNIDYGIKSLMEIKPFSVKSFPVSFIKIDTHEDDEAEMVYIKNEDIVSSKLY